MALNGHAPSHDRPAVFMLYLNAPAQDAYPSLCSFAALRVAGAGREGWMLMKTAYDDGGFSGGSMDRPALQRVLSDLQAGSVYVLSYQDDKANVRVSKETVIADPTMSS